MWIDDETLYQIYPIGFCGAPAVNDGVCVNRIKKVIDFIPHLKEMGVGGIYFSPVFESDSHGYDTRDFFNIDCRLGANEDFAYVCRLLHENGIKVILDGVFNHVGRGFKEFKDVLQNKWNSPYKDWFNISFDGNSPYNDGFWYEGWEGHYELVKLNLHNPAVRERIFSAIRFWKETFGIDGIRLDVAYLLDKNFLKELRWTVKQIDPDLVLIGEVLFGDYNLIVNGEMLDSCTNYENYKSLYSAFNSKNLFEISYSLNRQFGYEPWCIYKGKHLLTFVDNHDVSRIASILADQELLPVIYDMLFTMPGVPVIYYGSEWGVKGDKKDGDNALRPCFDLPEKTPLTERIAKLIKIRKSNSALVYGGYKNLIQGNEHLVFERAVSGEKTIVAINISPSLKTLYHGDLNGEFILPFTGESISLNGSVELKPKSSLILTEKK